MGNPTPIRSDLRVPLEFIRIPKTVEDRYLLFLSVFGSPTTYWPPDFVCQVIGMQVDDSLLRSNPPGTHRRTPDGTVRPPGPCTARFPSVPFRTTPPSPRPERPSFIGLQRHG